MITDVLGRVPCRFLGCSALFSFVFLYPSLLLLGRLLIFLLLLFGCLFGCLRGLVPVPRRTLALRFT